MGRNLLNCPLTLLVLELSHLIIQPSWEQSVVVRDVDTEVRRVKHVVYTPLFHSVRCGKDACGCVQDLLVPKGVCNPQPTKYSLYNARESLYPNVHYESLSVKLTTPDSEMKSPKMPGCRNVECGLPDLRK